MKFLDLCCCAGGVSVGVNKALKPDKIIGIDIKKQEDYPYELLITDVMDLSIDFLRQFDFIWASPPCQKYSKVCKWNGKEYPDLVEGIREKLLMSEVPYCIENVPGAPIREDLMLCGEMFGLGVIRHRKFEIQGFKILQPLHLKHNGKVITGDFVTCAGNGGHGSSKKSDWKTAMGIDWINDKWALAQAVPPVYSQYIASCFSGKPDTSLLKDGCPVKLNNDEWYYQQEVVQCGKKGCKCMKGNLHGPYWFKYKDIDGKRIKKYVGKNLSYV